jgi:hypothetical protein
MTAIHQRHLTTFPERAMQYLISVFYKQQPERPRIAQFLNPATLHSGDRYTRVFKAEIEFSNASYETVLDELFDTFNGHGKPLPAKTTPIPRSMSAATSSPPEKKHSPSSLPQTDSKD